MVLLLDSEICFGKWDVSKQDPLIFLQMPRTCPDWPLREGSQSRAELSLLLVLRPATLCQQQAHLQTPELAQPRPAVT